MFAPRPVLVEGPNDVLAFSSAIARMKEPEVISQTEFIHCGSCQNVAFWFFRAKQWGLDVKAIGDLDSLFNSRVQQPMDRISAVKERYANELYAVPAKTSTAMQDFIRQANKDKINANEKDRAAWLSELDEGSILGKKRQKILDIWRDEGFWLHTEGTIEDVLGGKKGRIDYMVTASSSGAIDRVINWCAFELNATGELFSLLELELERIAGEINIARKSQPEVILQNPIGTRAEISSRLVEVHHISDGRYRLIVKTPIEFAGYFMEFDRSTSAENMRLQEPRGD